MVTNETIISVCPNARRSLVNGFVEGLPAAMDRFGINTEIRIENFLAQCAVESGHFRSFEENLNYSAKRMTQVWPRRFPTIASARPYARNPKALANKTYGSRLGNRQGTDDGWIYRGRGAIQLTGRDNYAACGKATGLDLVNNPDLAADPRNAALIAGWFWDERGLNGFADRDDIKTITKRINGGYHGLRQRTQYRKAFGVAVTEGGIDPLWLKMGSRGPAVVQLQEDLSRLGYYVKADGVFGTDTQRAVMRFQREHGLDDDGLVGRETKDMLEEAVPIQIQDGEEGKTFVDTLKDSTVAKTGAGSAAAGSAAVVKEITESKEPTDISDAIDKVSEVGEKARSATEAVDGFSTLWTFVSGNMALVLAVVVVAMGGYIVWRNYGDIIKGKKKS